MGTFPWLQVKQLKIKVTSFATDTTQSCSALFLTLIKLNNYRSKPFLSANPLSPQAPAGFFSGTSQK